MNVGSDLKLCRFLDQLLLNYDSKLATNFPAKVFFVRLKIKLNQFS